MAGAVAYLAGNDFSANPDFLVLPAGDGLEYCNLFNRSSPNHARNLAPGKPPASLIGAPVPTADGRSVVFNGANHIRTALLDQDAFTMLAVGKRGALPTGVYAYLIGSYIGGFGAGMLIDGGDPRQFVGPFVARRTASDTTADNQGTAASSATFGCFATRASSADRTIFDDKTRGNRIVYGASSPILPRAISTEPYYIGHSALNDPCVNGESNIAFAAIWSRVLSDPELDSVYKRVQLIMARCGIAGV